MSTFTSFARALLPAVPLIGCSLPSLCLAEQRALLVGVGQYATPGIDLPAVDLDLERMREMLNRMGFADRQIRTLQDRQATSTNVIAAFESWLKQGVQPQDRVVFYFSGHGSNVPDLDGDENDGVDEVLVTHDMRQTKVKGRATLSNVVSDDKLAALMSAIPSKNIWIIVDACHSGTVSRSFTLKNRSLGSDPVFVKSFMYPGMPDAGQSAFARDVSKAPETNFVSLAAADDGEKAIGTMSGGVFTIGLTEAMARAATAGKNITVNQLRDEAAAYINKKLDKDTVHHPRVTGNPELADAALRIDPASVVNGPNRKKVLDLAGAQEKHFEMTASSTRYAVDEAVKFTLTLPTNGYLNVVTVDAKDNATVLFPNHHQENNAVYAGPFALPTKQMSFELLASEPTGPTLVVAFLSTDPINFYKQTLEDRDENGNITADFSTLSHTATRAIRVAPKKNEMHSAQIDLQIVEARK
jgi:metacaspase-1